LKSDKIDARVFSLSLSLSLIPGRGGGHRPNPFQVAPEASRIGCEGVSWPGVPPGVIMGQTLEHQMLDRLVGAVAVRTDGRVPAPDTMKVSCYQWGMTRAYLCRRHALVPGPITCLLVNCVWLQTCGMLVVLLHHSYKQLYVCMYVCMYVCVAGQWWCSGRRSYSCSHAPRQPHHHAYTIDISRRLDWSRLGAWPQLH